MSEPENFLARWSRLKRGGEEADREEADRTAPGDAAALPEGLDRAGAPEGSDETASPSDAGAERPLFDLASLPSIESITATTDIRPFLAPGVPTALRTAALRRVWVADPKIRDFIEIAENQWDFSAPDSIPGFSTFKPGDDVGRYVAELGKTGDKPAEPVASTLDSDFAATPGPDLVQQPAVTGEPQGPEVTAASRGDDIPPGDATSIVHRSEGGSPAREEPAEARHAALRTRRSRGGALPQ